MAITVKIESYTDWAEMYPFGKEMMDDFTEHTLENIDSYFEDLFGHENSDPVPFDLNPDNFYVNVLCLWGVEDLEKYGFTEQQLQEAFGKTNTHWLQDGVGVLDALKAVNPEAFEKLFDEYTIFGWTKDGALVLM